MYINVKSCPSNAPVAGQFSETGRSSFSHPSGSGLLFWLGLIAFSIWIGGATSLASDPYVMKIYPDGTKVILRWSEVGKSVDNGSTHGGAPKIVAYDPAKDGVVPVGEPSQ